MAYNFKFCTDNIVTAEEWKIVRPINEPLNPLYKVTQQCINNALLSCVFLLEKY